eukprot:2745204-Rhodomonas_salina.1
MRGGDVQRRRAHGLRVAVVRGRGVPDGAPALPLMRARCMCAGVTRCLSIIATGRSCQRTF